MEIRCNKCGELLKKDDTDNNFYIICSHCGNQIITFTPYEISTMTDKDGSIVCSPETDLSMQELAYADTTKVKFLLGGFNTGKTTDDAFLTYIHMIEIPNANYVVGANTLKQLEGTFLVEFMKFCPEENLVYKNKSAGLYILKNGSVLHLIPTDDEEKIKSMNLTGASMIEASGQKYEIFLQLKRRLRNKAAVVYDYADDGTIKKEYSEKFKRSQYKVKYSKFQLIIESNPEECWIYENEFYRAGKIFANVNRYPHNYTVVNPKRNTSVYIFDTMDNPYADAEYLEDIIDEGIESINTKIHGCLSPKQGYVFKELDKWDVVIPDNEVRDDFIRCKAMDFGFNDPTTMAKCYICPLTGAIVFYGEYYKTQTLIPEHANNLLPEITKENNLGIRTYGGIFGDSSGKNLNFNDKKSTFIHYREKGIILNPASNAPIDIGVELLLSLMSKGQIKIFASCTNMISELRGYRYKPIKKDADGRAINKLEDNKYIGSDHLIDPMRYIVMNLEIEPEKRIQQVYGMTYYNEFIKGIKKETSTFTDYVPVFNFKKKKNGRARSYGI